jgi:hypothetical protein
MTLSFKTGAWPLNSRFHCEMSTIIDTCQCGKQNSGKVVGGEQTLVNEYPSMAGLTDGKEGIICGGTISKKAHLTLQ